MEKDCSNVKTIKDVNDLWEYEDKRALGLGDSSKVSCGQSLLGSGYSELKDKYDKYYSDYDESEIAKAMCECCNELKEGRDLRAALGYDEWEAFYACMEKKGYKKMTEAARLLKTLNKKL